MNGITLGGGGSSYAECVLANSPGQGEVYRRKVALAASESGLSLEHVATSPTLNAFFAFEALANGRVHEAREFETKLYRNVAEIDGALFFPFPWSYHPGWPYRLSAPWVSSLPQGLALAYHCISFVRTRRPNDADAARKIAASFEVPMSSGGFRRNEEAGVFFDEYPTEIPTYVLNGAIFATLALADFARVFEDRRAGQSVRRAVAWFEEGLKRYDVTSPKYPGPVSAYSLAPSRGDVLFRLTGSGSARISKIEALLGSECISQIEVGSDTDDFRGRDAYLWTNPEFMNWGVRNEAAGVLGRAFVAGQGKFDHAPFTIALPVEDESELWIQLQCQGFQGEVHVQVYDGTEYHLVGIIDGSTAGTFRGRVPYAACERLKAAVEAPPPIDPAYFHDNFVLVSLLADASKSRSISAIAERWAASASWNTGALDPSRVVSFLRDQGGGPILAVEPSGLESVHTEYAEIVQATDGRFLFYGAFGDDQRWRIMHATWDQSSSTWIRQGELHIGGAPYDERASTCFAKIAFDAKADLWACVFAVKDPLADSYDAMHLAYSPDLVNWTWARKIGRHGGLPMHLAFGEYGYSLLYTRVDGQGFFLVETVSTDGVHWTSGDTLHALNSNGSDGFYTWSRFRLDGVEYFVGDLQLASDRNVWRLFSRAQEGRLVDLALPDLWRGDKFGNAWNAHRYGMRFATLDGTLMCFYNGISLKHGDGSGQIGAASVDVAALRAALKLGSEARGAAARTGSSLET